MKFVVLLCATLIFHCIAARSSEVAGYFQKQGTNFGWMGSTKHSVAVLFVICAGILYYVPQSRYYTEKGCLFMIGLVFGILKTTFSHVCGIFVSKVAGNDHSPCHVPKRHPSEQGPKTGDDDSRGRERKHHRHGERSRQNRERKYPQPVQRATEGRRFESASETTGVAHPVEFHAEKIMDNCRYTEARKSVLEKEKRSNVELFPQKPRLVRKRISENPSNHLERKCDAYEDSIAGSLPDSDQAVGNSRSNEKNAEILIRLKNFDDDKRETEVVESAVMFAANDSAVVAENEDVLAELENQIMTLEKTVQAMQLGIGEQKVDVIDDIVGHMKCSYSKIYEQMQHRRTVSPGTERAKNPTSGTAYLPRNATCVESDTDHLGSVTGAKVFQNEHPFSIHGNQKKLTADKTVKSSKKFYLDDDDELPPIITNRVKPYLIKTYNWFFTGCPGAKKYNVGKDGGGSVTAEPSL